MSTEKILTNIASSVENAEKSRFGRTVDDIISLGVGFTGGVIAGIAGKEYATAIITSIPILGYSLFSKTNGYGTARNATLASVAFCSGYASAEIMKASCK